MEININKIQTKTARVIAAAFDKKSIPWERHIAADGTEMICVGIEIAEGQTKAVQFLCSNDCNKISAVVFNILEVPDMNMIFEALMVTNNLNKRVRNLSFFVSEKMINCHSDTLLSSSIPQAAIEILEDIMIILKDVYPQLKEALCPDKNNIFWTDSDDDDDDDDFDDDEEGWVRWDLPTTADPGNWDDMPDDDDDY